MSRSDWEKELGDLLADIRTERDPEAPEGSPSQVAWRKVCYILFVAYIEVTDMFFATNPIGPT